MDISKLIAQEQFITNCKPLWSPIIGEVVFEKVENGNIFVSKNGIRYSFNSDGTFTSFPDAECMLFPSKDMQDWEFVERQLKKKEQFKPFQQVLVRDTEDKPWMPELYCAWVEDKNDRNHMMISRKQYTYCIPYEGNETLLMTI